MLLENINVFKFLYWDINVDDDDLEVMEFESYCVNCE